MLPHYRTSNTLRYQPTPFRPAAAMLIMQACMRMSTLHTFMLTESSDLS